MIFAKLPAPWQEAVVKEQAKRRERKPWVRISVPGLVTGDILAIVQEFTGKRLPEYEAGTGGFVFKVSKDKDRTRLLLLQNAETDGGRKIQATQHENEMSGDKNFDFVTERLRTDDMQVARSTAPASKSTVPTDTTVRQVASEQPKLHVQDSGGSGSPKSHAVGSGVLVEASQAM